MNNTMRVTGSSLGGLFLIGLGILFLLGQFLGVSVWTFLWPLFIIGFGLFFFVIMLAAGRNNDAGVLAIPGSLFVMLGLIFLYQTIFDYWASWAYVWALLAPTSIGIGLMIYSWWSNRPALRQPGLILIVLGVITFVVLGGFFELVIGLAGIQTPGRILWPVLLILLGVFLLVGRGLRSFQWTQANVPPATTVAADVTPASETTDTAQTVNSKPA
jgi:hypothetical protein